MTALLRAGQNALGVMLGNGMYRVLKTPGRYTKFVGSFGQLKCTVQLHVEFADGKCGEYFERWFLEDRARADHFFVHIRRRGF